jgi:hypothetical protein
VAVWRSRHARPRLHVSPEEQETVADRAERLLAEVRLELMLNGKEDEDK